MKIIPAIDIMDGHCVQLVGGEPGTEEFFGDPVEMALEWKQAGASMLHIIDLDAALGTGENLETVLRICRTAKLPVHFGGGIRDYERAEYLLNAGIDRIILGTMAVKDYHADFVNIRKLGEEFGSERLIVALDSRWGSIVVEGWQELTDLKAKDFVKDVEDLVWGFLYTDVDVEGRLQGINAGQVKEIISATEKPVIISGGITELSDLQKIKEDGAWGVVIGKALYTGRIEFKDALKSE
jgi:phosphoribosylformimino-5-aminoimidazole carboxamide ribotide isomerase